MKQCSRFFKLRPEHMLMFALLNKNKTLTTCFHSVSCSTGEVTQYARGGAKLSNHYVLLSQQQYDTIIQLCLNHMYTY